MTSDSGLTKKMEEYLFQRYNLRLESSADVLDVLGRVVNYDNSYELAILDETLTGLPTTFHVLKTIKDQNVVPNVLYLSSLHEITDSELKNKIDMSALNFNHMLGGDPSETESKRLFSIFSLIMKSPTIRDICQQTCQSLVESINVDHAVCVLPRFEDSPIVRGIVASTYPDLLDEPYEISLRGSRYFDELIDYFKPIHIPDLYEDKEFCQELMDKFSAIFRSALIVPMTISGKCLGYFGVFTQNSIRVFNLTDIDHCTRLADFAAATSLNLFLSSLHNQISPPVGFDAADDEDIDE